MAYRRMGSFTPPDISKAGSLEEVKSILSRWLRELCDKLNSELTSIERG